MSATLINREKKTQKNPPAVSQLSLKCVINLCLSVHGHKQTTMANVCTLLPAWSEGNGEQCTLEEYNEKEKNQ